MNSTQMRAHRVAVCVWVALFCLCLAWEWWFAPLRPGGSWLIAKALPLLWPLRGLLRADTMAMQWALILVLLYVLEGSVRIFEPQPVRGLAVAELTLSGAFFVAATVYLQPLKRAAKRRRAQGSET